MHARRSSFYDWRNPSSQDQQIAPGHLPNCTHHIPRMPRARRSFVSRSKGMAEVDLKAMCSLLVPVLDSVSRPESRSWCAIGGAAHEPQAVVAHGHAAPTRAHVLHASGGPARDGGDVAARVFCLGQEQRLTAAQ